MILVRGQIVPVQPDTAISTPPGASHTALLFPALLIPNPGAAGNFCSYLLGKEHEKCHGMREREGGATLGGVGAWERTAPPPT